MVRAVTDPDFVLSLMTSVTRRHWTHAAVFLLRGACRSPPLAFVPPGPSVGI